jgi:hypothetical protein
LSYDDTDLSDLNQARGLLGDTSTVELFTDDHIEAVVELYGFTIGVGFLARELEARFALKPSNVILPSGLSVSYARRTWAMLIVDMQAGGVTGGTAFSHGSTRNDGYSEAAAEAVA